MKKMSFYFRLILSTIMLAATVSCVDDLDVEPQDDQNVLADELFQDIEGYQALIGAAYANLALTGPDGPESSNIANIDAGTSQYGRALMNLQTFSTDEAVWTYENDPGIGDIQRSIWSSNNVISAGAYARIRYMISVTNNFLAQSTPDLISSRGFNSEETALINQYAAEARLLRAMAYYHMTDLFGKAPLLLENDPPIGYEAPELDRVELFNFVEGELLDIEEELEEPRGFVGVDYGRADRAVAWMILSKLYLNAEVYTGQGRYADALTYINKILNEGGYSLANEYKNLFRGDNDVNEANSEIIFAIISDGITVQNFGPTTVMTNGAVGSLEQNGANLGVTEAGWGGAIRVSPQFADKMLPSDDRNTLITDGRSANITNITDPATGFILEKYSNLTADGESGSDLTFSDVDFPMFRLGDVYLMYAEAVLRDGGGDQATALDYINQLRIRANAPQINSGDLTLDFIIDERARELYWELHRRQDLIRFSLFTGGVYNWALKGNSLINGTGIASFRDLYPIPANVVQSNDNLTQNEGY
ncbi:RagB/SusD family nutrient uptake outer membrane protein [Gangjinia marincola]